MRILKLVLIILIIGGLAAYGVHAFRLAAQIAAAASKETTAQRAEIDQCKERLKLFHAGLEKYKKDHKGSLPPTVESMVPKYIAKAELLACPTAERWAKKGRAVQQGQITINRRQYPVTYGFKWLTSSYARSVKRDGERAPLIACQTHEEAMYRAIFNKPPPLGVFGGDERTKLPSEVSNVHTIVLRSNGAVDELSAAAEE
jgi:hypothetical protein